MPAIELVRPAAEHLPSYRAALGRGWSPDNIRGAVAAEEELERIRSDAAAFIDSLEDREAKGPPVTLPDGSKARRIPGFRRWMWDGEFVGTIGLRWVPGTAELPPHVLGHIGYAVVPWKRRLGHCTRALAMLLPLAKAEGLPYVAITTDPDNLASRHVIEANGGVLVEAFRRPEVYGHTDAVRYHIALVSSSIERTARSLRRP